MTRWLEQWALRRAGKREAETLAFIENLKVQIEDGSLSADAVYGGPAVKLFVACAYEWYRKNGGENFATMEITHSKSGERFEMTMRRCHGKTPSEVIGELRAELAALKASSTSTDRGCCG